MGRRMTNSWFMRTSQVKIIRSRVHTIQKGDEIWNETDFSKATMETSTRDYTLPRVQNEVIAVIQVGVKYCSNTKKSMIHYRTRSSPPTLGPNTKRMLYLNPPSSSDIIGISQSQHLRHSGSTQISCLASPMTKKTRYISTSPGSATTKAPRVINSLPSCDPQLKCEWAHP